MRRGWIAVALIIGGAVVAGACGSEDSAEPPATSNPESSGEASADPVPDSASPSEAAEYVRRFYRLLNSGRYQEAWDLLPADVQIEAGSFAAWRRGYRVDAA